MVAQRVDLFSVFLVIPTGFLRALASKQVRDSNRQPSCYCFVVASTWLKSGCLLMWLANNVPAQLSRYTGGVHP